MSRGVVCRNCGGRTAEIARKCVHCGAEVERVAAGMSRDRVIDCPECGGKTSVVPLCGIEFDVCSECGGAWFDRTELDRFAEGVADESVRAEAREILALPSPGPASRTTEVRYLDCPICRMRMMRRNYKTVSGVIVDACDPHGCFLEREDLVHLVTVLAEEGLEGLERRAKQVAIERERERVAALGEAAAFAERQLEEARVRGWWLPFYFGW